MSIARLRLASLVLLCTVLLPSSAEAQRRGPPRVETKAISVGARLGFDVEAPNNAFILGAQSRLSVPGFPLEVQTVADVTFYTGVNDRQFNVDLLYDLGPISVGGGPAFRNTVWPGSDGARETRTGFSLVGILGGRASRSLISSQLEFRYSRVSDFSPSALMIGISIPLVRY